MGMLNVGRIQEGFVLDHIQAGKSMDIYNYLHLGDMDCCVAIIKNARSAKMGKKDIIKIGQVIDLDFAVLGYLDPGITVNVIRDGELAKREHLSLPERVTDIIRCKNPRCITMTEPGILQQFRLTDRKKKIYRCVFCDSEAPTEL